MKLHKNRTCELLIVILAVLVGEFLFFRGINLFDSNIIIGGNADGKLTALLADHWWKFFHGKEAFGDTLMFFPEKNTIGYSDMLLGQGIILSFFRLFGLDVYSAYKCTIVVIHFVGTFSSWYLLRKKLKCGVLWSSFGTIAFSYSDSYIRGIYHTQLVALSVVPLLAIFLIGFFEHFDDCKKRTKYAFLFLTLFVLLAYSSWYIACFTGFFCLFYLVIYIIVSLVNKFPIFKTIKQKLTIIWKDLIAYVLYTCLLFIPFLKVYIPTLKASDGFPYDTCIEYMPEPIDLINLSDTNLLFGNLNKLLKLKDRGISDEIEVGFSIILLILFIATFILLLKNNNYGSDSSDVSFLNRSYVRINTIAVFVTIITILVFTVRLNANGTSLWQMVYSVIPMAKSTRAIARFWLWLSFPMAIVTSYVADRFFTVSDFESVSKFWKQRNFVFSAVTVVFLTISCINTDGVYCDTNSLTEITPPPADASVIYITDSDGDYDFWPISMSEAYQIADEFDLKTANGYSGKVPDGWISLSNLGDPYYDIKVYRWVESADADGLYAYDKSTDTWSSFDEIVGSEFSPINGEFSDSLFAAEDLNGSFVWGTQHTRVDLLNDDIRESGLTIKIETQKTAYKIQNPNLDYYIDVYLDSEYLDSIPVIDGYAEYTFDMSEHESNLYEISIETNCMFIPEAADDERQLSFALYYIGPADSQ